MILSKKVFLLFSAFFLLVSSGATSAQDQVHYEELSAFPDQKWSVMKEEKGLAYRFQGYNAEKGVWNFFVKNKSEGNSDTPLADELNSISPAAGVQFNLEF